jgi:hypothetical protein
MRVMSAIAACALLACGAALAEDWVLVGSDAEVRHYVDRDSLRLEEGVARLDKRAVFAHPQPIGDSPGLPLVAETRGMVECDCSRTLHRAVSFRLLGVDGAVLYSSGDMRNVWETIEPGTPGLATLRYACGQTGAR